MSGQNIMDKSGKMIKTTTGIKLVVSLLAALLLEGFLAMAGICHGEGAEGIALWPGSLKASSGYQITEEEEGTLRFIQENNDPQIYFASSGVPYGSLRLEFAEPLEEDIPLQVYSSSGGEVYTENRYLLKGSQSAEFQIARRDYGDLRLDLDGSFLLKRVTAYPAISWAEADWGQAVSNMLPGRILVLWLLAFGAASAPCFDASQKNGEGRKRKNGRFLYLDLLRSIAACFAVAYHVLCVVMLETPAHTARWIVFAVGALIFLTCNPLFLLISGALLTGEKKESPWTFWRKRLVKTGIPLVLFYILYMAVFWAGDLSPAALAGRGLKTIISGSSDIAPHLWLMYALLLLYIPVPFLRKTVGRMTEKNGKILFVLIGIVLLAATVLKSHGMGNSFWFNWLLWLGIFLSGYFLTRPWMRRYDGWLFVLGAVTAAVSIRIMMVRPDYEGIIFNGSILICGITWAITAAAIRCERFLSPLSSVLSFIGRHSFTILLIHWLGLYGILLPGYIPGLMARGTVVRLAGTFGLTMAISLAVALVFDNFIFPGLQRIFSRTAS